MNTTKAMPLNNPGQATQAAAPAPAHRSPYYAPQHVGIGLPAVLVMTAVGLLLAALPPAAEAALISSVIGVTFDLDTPAAIGTSILISLGILVLAFLSGRSYRARKDTGEGHQKWVLLALGWILAGLAMVLIRQNAHQWAAPPIRRNSGPGETDTTAIENAAAAGDHTLALIFLFLHCAFGIIAWYEGTVLLNPIVFAHVRTSRKIARTRTAIANTAGLLQHVNENLEAARGAMAEQHQRLDAAEIDAANYARYLQEFSRAHIATLLGTPEASAMGRNTPKTQLITASPLPKS